MLTPIQPYTIRLHKEKLNSLLTSSGIAMEIPSTEKFPLSLQDGNIQYQLRADFPEYAAIGISHMLERFQSEDIKYKLAVSYQYMANGMQRKIIAIYTEAASGNYSGKDIINYISRCLIVSRSLAIQRVSKYIRDDKTITSNINELAALIREHIRDYGMHVPNIPIYSFDEGKLSEMIAWNFCNPADQRRSSLIYKDGRLYEHFENTTQEGKYLYAIISYFTGIGVVFSEKGYDNSGKLISGLSSVYIEVNSDEEKLWSYNLHMVLELLHKIK